MDLAGNDRPCDAHPLCLVIRRAELHTPQSHAGIRHAGEPGLQVTAETQVIYGHAMLPAQFQRWRADGARAEDADGFQVMDEHGDLFAAGGVGFFPFVERQVFWKHGHLHLQREMIPRHIAAVRGGVEGVLGDAVHENLSFGSSHFKQPGTHPRRTLRIARGTGQADVEEGAVLAGRFEDGRRHRAACGQLMQGGDGLLRQCAQFGGEGHLPPPLAVRMEDRPGRDDVAVRLAIGAPRKVQQI